MNEAETTTSARSRRGLIIFMVLGIAVAIALLGSVASVVTVCVVTEKYDSFLDAVRKGDAFAVRCFLLRHMDVNAKDLIGRTLLHCAAFEGHMEVAELLIARGADVNAKDKWDGTLLHCAAFEGHMEVAELLIAKGADVNAKSNVGWTPLYYADGNAIGNWSSVSTSPKTKRSWRPCVVVCSVVGRSVHTNGRIRSPCVCPVKSSSGTERDCNLPTTARPVRSSTPSIAKAGPYSERRAGRYDLLYACGAVSGPISKV